MSKRAGRDDGGERYSFRNLLLWQKGQALAASVIKLTDSLPGDCSQPDTNPSASGIRRIGAGEYR